MSITSKEKLVSLNNIPPIEPSLDLIDGLEVVVAQAVFNDRRVVSKLEGDSVDHVSKFEPPKKPRGLWDKAYFDWGKLSHTDSADSDT